MNDSIWTGMARVSEFTGVDAGRFAGEVLPRNRPAVLRGLVGRWPAVAEAQRSPRAVADYLRRFSNEQPATVFVGEPDIEGRFFYSEDLKGFNYEQQAVPLGPLLTFILQHLDDPRPPAIYAGAVYVPEHAPGLLAEHTMPLLDPSLQALPSLWVGNRTRIPAHWDLPQNIACVIAGRRRYTLFPAEQVANLYVGPLDFTPAGQAISLVDFCKPDYARFPRFREALAHAEVAELGPGDALYLPSLWFHHAESLDAFGLMLNYWWRTAPPYMFTPYITMLHALLTIRDLPAAERERWRAFFDHYIFQTAGVPMEHVPMAARGAFATMTPEGARRLMTYLQESLRRQHAAAEKQ